MTISRYQAPGNRAKEYFLGSKEGKLAISAICEDGNGTTKFGKIEKGTVMGRITASKKVRPAYKSTVTTGATSATQTVGSTENVYPGDVHYFVTADDTRTVLTVDSGTQITYDSSITTTTGEVVQLNDGSEDAIGILDHTHDTSEDREDPDNAGSLLHSERGVRLMMEGAAHPGDVTGHTPEVEADLNHWIFVARESVVS